MIQKYKIFQPLWHILVLKLFNRTLIIFLMLTKNVNTSKICLNFVEYDINMTYEYDLNYFMYTFET